MGKRALLSTFLGFLLLSLIACGFGGGEETPEPTEAAPAEATSPTATEAPPEQVPTAESPAPTPVATEGELFLQLVEPAEAEVFTNVGSMDVVGRTRVDAMVTINDTIVEPNIDGEFSLSMALEEGPNIIEVVASIASGEQMDLVLVAVYVP